MTHSLKPRILWLASRTVIACALCLAGAARANLIANGSFETGPAPGTWINLPNGSAALTNWTVSPGNVDYIGNLWLAQTGNCSLALNGTLPGGVTQSFPTYAGALYGVSFYLSGDPFTAPALKHVRVAAAGSSADFTFDVSLGWPWDMQWTKTDWTFTATASSTALEFYSLDSGDVGPVIDNVDVTLLSSLDATGGALTDFALAPASPNPTPGRARVDYAVPRQADVRVSVFDVAGREVALLASGPHASGRYSVEWNGGAARNSPGSALFFIRLQTSGRSLIRRVALVR